MQYQTKLKALFAVLVLLVAGLLGVWFILEHDNGRDYLAGLKKSLNGFMAPKRKDVEAAQAMPPAESSGMMTDGGGLLSMPPHPPAAPPRAPEPMPGMASIPGSAQQPKVSAAVKNPFPFYEEERNLLSTHNVVKNDTVSGIAGMHWGNAFLWPDLYVHNDWRSNDPDLIYPGEAVKIIGRLGKNGRFSAEDIKVISESYIMVYEKYKQQGPHKDPSAWHTLVSALRFDSSFLERYQNRINPEDSAIARKQASEIKRFD